MRERAPNPAGLNAHRANLIGGAGCNPQLYLSLCRSLQNDAPTAEETMYQLIKSRPVVVGEQISNRLLRGTTALG